MPSLCRTPAEPYDRAVSRILITGATGFVGRALVPVLAPLHRLVLAHRRAAEGPAQAGTEDQFVGEIGPATDWSRALSEVDAVVHLAAHVHATGERADPARF